MLAGSNIQNSATALLFGLLFNWGLQGILLAQVYTYHIAFPNDRVTVKIIAYTVFVIECAQTALLTYGGHLSLAKYFGDTAVLEKLHLNWVAIPLLCGVGFIAHMVYVYRIYTISKSKIMSGLIILTTLLQLSSAITEAIHARESDIYPVLIEESTHIVVIWSLASAVCDLLIAASMSFYLLKYGSGLSLRTDRIINRLIRLSVEAGIITATATSLNAILFLALPHNEAFNFPGYILTKLYSITLLRLFNSRVYMKKSDGHGGDWLSGARGDLNTSPSPLNLSTVQFAPGTSPTPASPTQRTPSHFIGA